MDVIPAEGCDSRVFRVIGDGEMYNRDGEKVVSISHTALMVPYLRQQGKYVSTHGYEGDVGITKGYVCDKYERDGKYYVEMVAWSETIEGHIWSECYAVVELPAKKDE